MKILTIISNEEEAGFNLLKLSCVLNQLDLVAIVPSQQKTFKSRRVKDSLLKHYLAELPQDELVFFTDGYDAIFVAGEEEILAKFHQTGRDLVFSAETNCWPDGELASRYPPMDASPYKYLNSGGFIGKAGLIRELLADDQVESDRFENSNQYLWAQRFLKYPGLIGLDTHCELFCTFSPEIGEEYVPTAGPRSYYSYYDYFKFKNEWFDANFSIEAGRLLNKITNTWPCHAHFNGLAKCLMTNKIKDMLLHKLLNSKRIQTLYADG